MFVHPAQPPGFEHVSLGLPAPILSPQAATLASFQGFTEAEKSSIRTGNALRLFPRLASHQVAAPS